MTNGKISPASLTQTKWILDVLVFIGFLIAMDPRSTGIPIHEWFTLAALAAITIHLLLNWGWVAQVTRRFFGCPARSRLNYILNWLLFMDGILVMLSGILISKAVVPALGIQLHGGFVWRQLHDTSANLSLFLLGLHTALHWDWIVSACRRFILQPIGRLFPRKDGMA